MALHEAVWQRQSRLDLSHGWSHCGQVSGGVHRGEAVGLLADGRGDARDDVSGSPHRDPLADGEALFLDEFGVVQRRVGDGGAVDEDRVEHGAQRDAPGAPDPDLDVTQEGGAGVGGVFERGRPVRRAAAGAEPSARRFEVGGEHPAVDRELEAGAQLADVCEGGERGVRVGGDLDLAGGEPPGHGEAEIEGAGHALSVGGEVAGEVVRREGHRCFVGALGAADRPGDRAARVDERLAAGGDPVGAGGLEVADGHVDLAADLARPRGAEPGG